MVKSIKVYQNFNIKKDHKNSIILIGNFDGLHVGHQKLFLTAKNIRKNTKLKLVYSLLNQCQKCFLIKT